MGQARSIRVVVRVRPALASDATQVCAGLNLEAGGSAVTTSLEGRPTKRYAFDAVIRSGVPQAEVYQQAGVQGLVDAVVAGYHATVFAYGQTGSGKTFTMEGFRYTSEPKSARVGSRSANPQRQLGGVGSGSRVSRPIGLSNVGAASSSTAIGSSVPGRDTSPTVPMADFEGTAPDQLGIVPRAVAGLFAALKLENGRRYTLRASFVQIYMEQVYDLLNPTFMVGARGGGPGVSVAGSLKLRWSKADDFYLENLFKVECSTAEEVMEAFKIGVQNKVMSSHKLNAASSRSHCLFQLHLDSSQMDAPSEVVSSRLTLVDLAGSERQATTGAVDGLIRDESIFINKSLFTLRQVIMALTEASTTSLTPSSALGAASNSTPAPAVHSTAAAAGAAVAAVHVPYRDSKLTCLLKGSLGGNSVTMMLACIAAPDCYSDENISTLEYAARASRITNQVAINEDPRTALVRQLRNEVAFLRQQLAVADRHASDLSPASLLPEVSSRADNARCIGSARGAANPMRSLPSTTAAARFAPIGTIPCGDNSNNDMKKPGSDGSCSEDGAANGNAVLGRICDGNDVINNGGSSSAVLSLGGDAHRALESHSVTSLAERLLAAVSLLQQLSDANAGLRAAYARSAREAETAQRHTDGLASENAQLRNQLSALECMVHTSADQGSEMVVGANGGEDGRGSPSGSRAALGAIAQASAMVELTELRRENALLHERLQQLEYHCSALESGGGTAAASGSSRRFESLHRTQSADTSMRLRSLGSSSRPGTSASGAGGSTPFTPSDLLSFTQPPAPRLSSLQATSRQRRGLSSSAGSRTALAVGSPPKPPPSPGRPHQQQQLASKSPRSSAASARSKCFGSGALSAATSSSSAMIGHGQAPSTMSVLELRAVLQAAPHAHVQPAAQTMQAAATGGGGAAAAFAALSAGIGNVGLAGGAPQGKSSLVISSSTEDLEERQVKQALAARAMAATLRLSSATPLQSMHIAVEGAGSPCLDATSRYAGCQAHPDEVGLKEGQQVGVDEAGSRLSQLFSQRNALSRSRIT